MGLNIDNLTVGYVQGIDILNDVSMHVKPGNIMVVIGPNGVGKTTLLKTIFGFLKPTRGSVSLNGRSLASEPPHVIARSGIGFVPQDAGIFPHLSILDHLELAARTSPTRANHSDFSLVEEKFPVLLGRGHEAAGNLSGGQRKQLEIAMALVSDPAYLLVDEPSVGLSPDIARSIYSHLQELRDQGMGMLLVDQQVKLAVEVADEVTVLDLGTVTDAGSGAYFRRNISEVVKGWLTTHLERQTNAATSDQDDEETGPVNA